MAHVKHFEGLRLKTYTCPSGVLTIGYGHTHGVVSGMSFDNEADAAALLYADLILAFNQVKSLHKSLDEDSPLAFVLTDFVFNIGFTKYKNSTLRKIVDGLKDVNNLSKTDIDAITIQLLLWCHSRGKKLRGLVKRREWEVSLLSLED